MDSGMY